LAKKFFSIFFIIIIAVSMFGCGDPELNLTEEEEQKIVGYAADVMLKYDSDHGSRLVDTSAARELDARVEALKELNAQLAEQEAAEQENESSENASDGNGTKEPSQKYPPEGEQDIAAALGLDGFSVSYRGYEVCRSYPYDGSSEEFFAMDATAGKQLVVFHFDVANMSDAEAQCDILDSYPIFRIIVNDNDRVNALTTMLENDLSTVDDVFSPGEVRDTVVVLETAPGFESGIDSLSLLMKYNGNQSVIPLD